ncbi:SRPBCC family protein [Sphingopyxis sp. OPL5]|uniref:SRPBCC family protein n=1 Tax=Sphingopyxis sp. OPL5 TaxID=2486273 RepID=UPI00164D159F|nr:SRPBCC family protein [Sphingopyxis sp. OPL5]QNO28237.1 SRPBCC family protein [Sphingopyxis sp. OPL5]
MSNETELTISRLIKAPPSAVWDAWSDPAKLAAWWIPAPIECRVDTLDLRPGGGFVTRMREGDGAFQPHVDGCFLEAVPEKRLVFTTVLTEGWQPAEPWLAITAILTFEAQDGGTLYAARVLHKNPEDSAKHDEMGFQEGWGTAIGQLAALIDR